MKIKLILLFFVVIASTSCKNNETLFEVKHLNNKDKNVVQYLPNITFTTIQDSTYSYFSKDDYYKVLSAEISRGDWVYKSEKFDLRIILRTYSKFEGNQYEFVLRTFSKDFKIIDSYVMSGTFENIACDGSINNDLLITTICDDGTSRTATIDEYGKFIINE